MNYSEISLGTNHISLGNLLGTSGSPALMKQISSMSGYDTGAFGTDIDPFRNNFQQFMQVVVEPIREVNLQLQQAKAAVQIADEIRPITTVADLKKGIPPCMVRPILMYEPIRALAEDGRVDAWGIDASLYPKEDVYARLINNGGVDLLPENFVDGGIEIVEEWHSDDPELTMDQLDAIEVTRIFLSNFLEDEETKHIDPTAYPELRG